MHENKIEVTKAILVAVDIGEYDIEASLDELEELAQTAQAEVVGRVTQKLGSFVSATCMGKGRLEELAEECKVLEAELLIFDHELTGSQLRNIEAIVNVRIIDRTMLILDIFAARAKTMEGKLQVEMAQQKYRLPRLMGIGSELSRQGGGIGTRGPGETKLETDRRHINHRISVLEKELAEMKKHRDYTRRRRKKDNILSSVIVGYTNVGKSTLLNALTDAGVIAENKLFATLDITSRAIMLPDGRSTLLTDTVGLIRRLPHHLVEAFKSTLEEAAEADLIINLMDISDKNCAEQYEVTIKLLEELGCSETPRINVLNKSDIAENAMDIKEDDRTVKISAKKHIGFEKLLSCIAANLPVTALRMKLLIPYSETPLIADIRSEGKIFSEEFLPDGTLIDALVDKKIHHRVKKFTAE